MSTEDWTMSDESAGSDLELDFCAQSFYSSSNWNSELETGEMQVVESRHKLMDHGAEDSDIEEKIEKAANTLHEIFVESCCALYNDILDELATEQQPVVAMSFEDLPPTATCIVELLQKRQCVLMRQADQLAIEIPQLADTVHLRVLAVGRAMEQLRIKQQENDLNETGKPKRDEGSKESRHQYSALPAQFRKWLQCSEQELESIKEQIAGARTDLQLLHRLRANQQASDYSFK
uniref:Uncharacterized protein n=1 Tax=Ditylenchus dipsaci TaxID=166011 RepID=A0A915DNV4_9BILA